MRLLEIPTRYYQHFDADTSLKYPAEGYGGWRKTALSHDLDHTGIVVMHAWDCGQPHQFPGWRRAVEYIPRADEICSNALPAFLDIVRAAKLPIIHVVAHQGYYETLPGYQKVLSLTPPPQSALPIESDATTQQLRQFRTSHVFPGTHNLKDIAEGFARLDFPEHLKPREDELIAATSDQLVAVCRHYELSHLIYTGFAINGCLWTSPGGMIDLCRQGVLCSTIAELTTAIENKTSITTEAHKEYALWKTTLLYGFVFDVDDISNALKAVNE